MTDPWGIKVSAVVISDVILPIEMQALLLNKLKPKEKTIQNYCR